MPRRYLGRRPPHANLVLPHVSEVAALPPVSIDADWSRSVAAFGMYGNGLAGCCTYTAAANARHQFGVYAGRAPAISDAEVLHEYALATGWPAQDPGRVETDVLHDWMTKGFTFGEQVDRIDGYAAVRHDSVAEVRQMIALFGGVMVGAELPETAEDSLEWQPSSGPRGAVGSLGGHEMWCNAADDQGVQLITWGERARASWDWFLTYVDDVQVVLSRDWLLPNTDTPAGVDWAALNNAMANLEAA